MTKSEFLAYFSTATVQPGCVVGPAQFNWMVINHVDTMKSFIAYAVYAVVTEADKSYNVSLSYGLLDGEPTYSIACGDSFLNGLASDVADERIKEALNDVGLPLSFTATVSSALNSLGPQGPCPFFLNFRRSKTICGHVKSAMALFEDGVALCETLENSYAQLLNRAADEASADLMSLEEMAFKVPVLYMGERGSSKTVTAREFARNNGYQCIEMPGNEGVEASDLKGVNVMFNGSAAFLDGEVTEAFRRAQTDKVVLILDELLRVPVRQLSILLTALSPDNGVYRLRTGRILSVTNGLAVQETLECPVENLCIIATTNIGSEYAVDEIDPALAERFMLVMKNTTVDGLKRVLRIYAKARGFSEAVVEKTAKFYAKMKDAVSRELLPKGLTTRTAARAFMLATDEADVCRCLRAQALQWVNFTSSGEPVPEHLKLIGDLLDNFEAQETT